MLPELISKEREIFVHMILFELTNTFTNICLFLEKNSATMKNFWRIHTSKCVEYYSCQMILELNYKVRRFYQIWLYQQTSTIEECLVGGVSKDPG